MSKKPQKQYDFTRSKQRFVALKILYFGWDYDGLADQADNTNTIEYHLFSALLKTCLIESRAKCKYSRCGRTDKGVSSYGQVVSLAIRSNLIDEEDPQNIGLFTPEDYKTSQLPEVDLKSAGTSKEEVNYVDTLNRVLPSHIRVLAWAPIRAEFSSRFNCLGRSYSYIFPRGDLCLESMRAGLDYLVGEHDFRNLCSFDLKNGVTSHHRNILSVDLRHISSIGKQDEQHPPESTDQYSFVEIVINGKAFLYHQIRCIMTIIFLIGTRKEPPELVRDLLDINKCPARPNYNRASPMPLSLFDCKYSPDDMPLGWVYEYKAVLNIYRQLKQLWLNYRTKSMMIERVLSDLESSLVMDCQRSKCWKDFGLDCDNMSDTKYIPVLKRPRDEPLEIKLDQISRKRQKADQECSAIE